MTVTLINKTDDFGQKQGLWEHYYFSNLHGLDVWKTGNYINDKEYGQWQSFHSKNRLGSIGEYKRGERIGLWELYADQDKLIKTIIYIN